mmetsp:Transcript_63259/g.72747  ORF Transcript_63259/g.72747 Transcript_63259/m.72747 type:complete len:89 (+) Transcript_63259:108-374(+)
MLLIFVPALFNLAPTVLHQSYINSGHFSHDIGHAILAVSRVSGCVFEQRLRFASFPAQAQPFFRPLCIVNQLGSSSQGLPVGLPVGLG